MSETGLGLGSHQQPIRLCLLAHGLTTPSSSPPQAHPQHYIQVEDFRDLLDQLANDGFDFVLPMDAGEPGRNACSVTFDDGYANNALFLPLAEQYGVPFVLFVASYNIEEQRPFLWDLKQIDGSGPWRHWVDDYRELYQQATGDTMARLMNDDNHRPLTVAELQALAASPWAHLGLHTHRHQPLVGRHLKNGGAELEENRRFLRQFPRFLPRDLALPCGFYTPWTAKRLLREGVDRLYTCDGANSGTGPIVHRISLVSPALQGSLIDQVRRSFKWRFWLRRQAANIRYSNMVLNEF